MASRESFGKIGSDDDWEEIADNYSVKSLSSDDEEDEKPAASPVPTRSKVESSPRSQTSPTRHARQVNESHDANDANMSKLGDALSAVDIGRSLGDTLDLDETSTDPIVIDNALQSLSRMLRDTSPALCIMHLKHATKVLPACKSLLAQVDSLTPILAVYAAKCNQPRTTARDVPLDASLMMWIASLSRTLWEIGFEFKIVESNNHGSSSPKRAPSLETLVGELESAAMQMDEFLPIIQADFAEFQKKPMYVFPGITAAPAPLYEIETPNDYQRPRIRQTMYGLKKELQHAISILKDCQRWLPDAAKVIVGDVTNGMGILFDVVGAIMASNGPAWIEGLTSETGRPRLINHSEFGNLDPIVIEDYSARIQQICGLVHIDAAESRTWSEEMIREHHVCMLIEQQQIDSLEHIVSVLKGMLLR
ncbi:hypothetical protein K4K51_005632 [Colletotrichum sp. SAR 10_75]|nr:hypothetical protein K4K51_005632 [Colletotrichum sp. SAR 10_75]